MSGSGSHLQVAQGASGHAGAGLARRGIASVIDAQVRRFVGAASLIAAKFISSKPLRRGDHHKLGDAGEAYAAKWLRGQGYTILRRNAHTPTGEIDILARAPDKRTIVVVEVKTREPIAGRPRPERQVDPANLVKLATMLAHLTKANGWHDRPRRIDVIGIDWPAGGEPELRHHVGVFVAKTHSPKAR